MATLYQNPDGANYQAQATLAYLRGRDGIEDSWDGHQYAARPEVDRWHNGREEGYVVTMRSEDYKRQINIAFFEHRNSDTICAIEWEQHTLNPPTIETMDAKGKVYKDKYDVSHTVKPGQASEMADWINDRLIAFWKATAKKKRVA